MFRGTERLFSGLRTCFAQRHERTQAHSLQGKRVTPNLAVPSKGIQAMSINKKTVVNRAFLGELIGANGNETLSLFVMWVMATNIGVSGSFYIAALLLSTILFGLFGGKLFAGAHPFALASHLNSLRFVATSGMIIATVFDASLTIIMALAIVASALRTHVDSAIFGGISGLGLDAGARSRATALVDSAFRLARISGPAAAAAAAWAFGDIAVGGSTAVLFAAAAAILFLISNVPVGQNDQTPTTPDMTGPHRPIDATLATIFLTQAVNAAGWYMSIIFTMAIVFSSNQSGGISGYALIIAAYGCGNIAGSLAFRRREIRDPLTVTWVSRLFSGAGYLMLAAANDVIAISAVCFFIASSAPAADLAFLKKVQTDFGWRDVTRLYRTKMICEYTGMLISMLLVSSIVAHFSYAGVHLIGGSAISLAALFALWQFKWRAGAQA